MRLRTALSPEECRRRLESSVSQRWVYWGAIAGEDVEVFGKVQERRFLLHLMRPYLRNSFKPLLVGHLAPEGRGTLVTADFRMHRFVRVFLAVWFAGVGLIGGTVFVAALACLALARCHGVQHPEIGLAVAPGDAAVRRGARRRGPAAGTPR